MKTSKKALLTSILSLVLCCSMLVGTTFAWFTDEAASGINTITAGNLDVNLYHSDKAAPNFTAVSTDTKLFDDVTLWEPGVVAYENLKVTNEGNLELKYTLAVSFANATAASGKTLADVLKVAVVAPVAAGTERETLLSGITGNQWQPLAAFALPGALDTANHREDTYGIVIYWEPSGNDNDYMGLKIDLGVSLFATQAAAENDSFGNDYDVNAPLPKYVSGQSGLNEAVAGGAKLIQLSAGTYTLPATTNNSLTLVGNGETVIDLTSATGLALSGTDITLENLTVQGDNADYHGLQHAGNVVYNNVVFNDSTTLYGESVTFNNCVFNLTSRYIWTYGAGEVTFNNCVFHTNGKAVLIYSEDTVLNQTVNVNNCVFNASAKGYTGDNQHCAAIEIDSHLVSSYTLNITGTNIYSENFNGLYRIKKNQTPSNVTVNKNGTIICGTAVTTADELAAALTAGGNIVLVNDIDLTGIAWTPVAPAANLVLDGNGYTISNLTCATAQTGGFTNYSLIGQSTKDVTVKNVKFDKATITGNGVANSHGAVVLATSQGNVIMEKVTVTNSTVSNCDRSSLIFTYEETTGGWTPELTIDGCIIENCTINSIGTAGALHGYNNSYAVTIKNCTVKNTTISSSEGGNKAGILLGTNGGSKVTLTNNTYENCKASNAGTETNNEVGRVS